jgi:hypothetical protein
MAKKQQRGGKRTGAGRKPIHPEGVTMTVAAKVPVPLVERLDTVAEKRGWNRSEAITEAIRGLLKRQERKSGVSIPSVDADPSGSL